jgi:hypothetical protein
MNQNVKLIVSSILTQRKTEFDNVVDVGLGCYRSSNTPANTGTVLTVRYTSRARSEEYNAALTRFDRILGAKPLMADHIHETTVHGFEVLRYMMENSL